MDNNQKKFNLYVFLSTFARNLIEVFIPIILYKSGYSLQQVVFYFLLVNAFSLLLSYPCILFSKNFNNKTLSLIGIISFVSVQLMLNNISINSVFLTILSFLYALYRRGYWIPRRFYNMKIMQKKDVSITYTFTSIINQLGIIIASYVGSLFLDFISIDILTIISIIIFLISLIPLNKLHFEKEQYDIDINILPILKTVPKRDMYIFGVYELNYVVKFLFPLYLFIYVKSNYQVVGIMEILTNIATIIFAYIYGKKINKSKNYLRFSIVFVVLVWFFKANITSYLLIIIAFLEGISLKMLELSMNKEFFNLSKKFEYENYNLFYEILQNTFRTIMLIILYIFVKDLKVMIYLCLTFMSSGILLNFQQLKIKDYK